MSVYCLCRWIPSDSFLRVSFTNSILHVSQYENVFIVINNGSYDKAIEFFKSDFKKKSVRCEILEECPYRIDYMVSGDIALNFIKIKTSINYYIDLYT